MKNLIVISGQSRSGKSTFASMAEECGFKHIDISKFLARMTISRLGLAGTDLDYVDANKDTIMVEGLSLRDHIIQTGKVLDVYVPDWVVSEVIRGDTKLIVPSIKSQEHLDEIKQKLNGTTLITTVLIHRPGTYDTVRTFLKKPDYTIHNDEGLAEFKIRCRELLAIM
jgi:cytidylate kinase